MKRRRGNPTWGKPDMGPVVPTITEFEKVVSKHELSPEQYRQSEELRAWAQHNKNSKYVPEDLLKAWGFPIELE